MSEDEKMPEEKTTASTKDVGLTMAKLTWDVIAGLCLKMSRCGDREKHLLAILKMLAAIPAFLKQHPPEDPEQDFRLIIEGATRDANQKITLTGEQLYEIVDIINSECKEGGMVVKFDCGPNKQDQKEPEDEPDPEAL